MIKLVSVGGAKKKYLKLTILVSKFVPWDQGLTGSVYLLSDGTGRVLAKKFGYWDGSGRVMRTNLMPKITL